MQVGFGGGAVDLLKNEEWRLEQGKEGGAGEDGGVVSGGVDPGDGGVVSGGVDPGERGMVMGGAGLGEVRSSEHPVTVSLIQATQLLAHHVCLMRAQVVEEEVDTTPRVVEPSHWASGEDGLVLEEGIVEVDGDHQVTLMVQNHGSSPVHLVEGQVLGTLQKLEFLTVAHVTVGEGTGTAMEREHTPVTCGN